MLPALWFSIHISSQINNKIILVMMLLKNQQIGINSLKYDFML